MQVRLLALLALIISFGSSAEAERFTAFIQQSGMWRSFIVHTPEGVAPTPQSRRPASATEYPVIFAFHPATTTGAGMEYITRLHEYAKDFIVVYPSGYGGTWNVGNCCGAAREANMDDVGFFRAILDYLETNVADIEPRAYLTGFSNGALLSYRLLCEQAESVAAVVAHGAMTSLKPDCQPGREVPVMHLHGEMDTYAPYEIAERPWAVEQWRYLARDRYGLPDETQTTRFEGEVSCQERGDGFAVFCLIPDLGHVWPGHEPSGSHWGPTRTDLNGSAEAMRFFREQR